MVIEDVEIFIVTRGLNFLVSSKIHQIQSPCSRNKEYRGRPHDVRLIHMMQQYRHLLLCLYQSHQLQVRGCVGTVAWTKTRNAMQVMRETNAATKIVNSGSKSKVKFNVGEQMFKVQIPTWHLQFISLNAIISFHKVKVYMYFIH